MTSLQTEEVLKKEQEILKEADEIKLRRYNAQKEIEEKKIDDLKKSWYATGLNALKDKLRKCDNNLENIDEEVKKFKIGKTESIICERERIEQEIKSLGAYKGQCLHLGAKKSTWITDRYDSHGYEITSCAVCGKSI